MAFTNTSLNSTITLFDLDGGFAALNLYFVFHFLRSIDFSLCTVLFSFIAARTKTAQTKVYATASEGVGRISSNGWESVPWSSPAS